MTCEPLDETQWGQPPNKTVSQMWLYSNNLQGRLPARIADLYLPIEVENRPGAVVSPPIAVEPSPEAMVPLPIAVDNKPEAVASAPIAIETKPEAVVDSTIAVE